jgi:NAD-dependent DNA ligase
MEASGKDIPKTPLPLSLKNNEERRQKAMTQQPVCPKCGTEMRVNKGGFFCKDEESCKFRLWRRVAGKELEDEELQKLLEGQKVLATGLKSKKGNDFSAWLTMQPDGDIKFSFEDLPKS